MTQLTNSNPPSSLILFSLKSNISIQLYSFQHFPNSIVPLSPMKLLYKYKHFSYLHLSFLMAFPKTKASLSLNPISSK